MSVPRQTHTIKPVKIRDKGRLATALELNPAPGGATCHCEARGKGCWAVTQVKGLSPEITIVSEADAFHIAVGNILTTDRQGGESPTGSEATARHQMERVGTWETRHFPEGVCGDKPNKGKGSQTRWRESDKPIVAMKPRNGGGAKGLTIMRQVSAETSVGHRAGKRVETQTGTLTPRTEDAWLKSRMRENLTYGSVRGHVADSVSHGRWL